MNVLVAIDDFGTGYSSLSSLSEFPLDSLTIDRKFIQHTPHNRQSICLTTAMIGLAHNFGLKVVAEGIETGGQLDFLTRHQCDEGQGYLFSKPMPSDKTFDALRATPSQLGPQ